MHNFPYLIRVFPRLLSRPLDVFDVEQEVTNCSAQEAKLGQKWSSESTVFEAQRAQQGADDQANDLSAVILGKS